MIFGTDRHDTALTRQPCMSDDDTTIAASTTVGIVALAVGLALRFCTCFSNYRCTAPADGCGIVCRDRTIPHPADELKRATDAAAAAAAAQIAQLQAQLLTVQTEAADARARNERHTTNAYRFYERALAMRDTGRIASVRTPRPQDLSESSSSISNRDSPPRRRPPPPPVVVASSETAVTQRARWTHRRPVAIDDQLTVQSPPSHGRRHASTHHRYAHTAFVQPSPRNRTRPVDETEAPPHVAIDVDVPDQVQSSPRRRIHTPVPIVTPPPSPRSVSGSAPHPPASPRRPDAPPRLAMT